MEKTAHQPKVRNAQLDALRAFAIGIVLIHHYQDTRFFLSGFGATLFFVLSGYFATKTLLRLKRGVEGGQVRVPQALKTFYFNRWMRIWPPYYLFLVLTVIAGVEGARTSFVWNAAFLANFQILREGDWTGPFSPLWSLSVLEQFYLFWPAVLFACPKKLLLPTILVLVSLAPLYRLGCYFTDASSLYWIVMPFASFDQLGCGALLALCSENLVAKAASDALLRAIRKLFVPLFLLIVLCKICNIELPCGAIYISTIASFAFLSFINRVTKGIGGPLGWFMDHPFLGHIGRLSYSIFLLHDFTELLFPDTGFLGPLLKSNYRAFLLIPVTVLLAHISWRLIEAPLLALRKKILVSPPIPAGESS